MTPRRHKLGNRKYVLGPKLMFAKRDKQDPSRSGKTSLATEVTNITKPVTKINIGPSKCANLTCA